MPKSNDKDGLWILLGVLILLDIITTFIGVGLLGLPEAHPLGYRGVMVGMFFTLLIVGVLYFKSFRLDNKWLRIFFNLVCGIKGFVVVNNLVWIGASIGIGGWI